MSQSGFTKITNALLPPSVATSYIADIGIATPSLNVLNILGGNGVSITGFGNTLTVAIASNYAGQSSITTLGTIVTGTWNATKINETYGGTNQTSYATGDILYASAANTLSKLPIGINANVLTVVSGIPAWVTPPPSYLNDFTKVFMYGGM